MSSLGSLGAECWAGAGDRGGAPGVAGRGVSHCPGGGPGSGWGGGRRGRGARSLVRPLGRSPLGPGMVAGALSLPHPPPLGMLSGGSFYYGYLFNFFFWKTILFDD